MRELSAQLLRWHAQHASYAVATAVDVTGSAPRLPGATMAVNDEGAVMGSISGGCVEAAVYDLCGQVLRSGMPAWETFGHSDSDAFAVGLTCGGEVQVFVHRVTPREYPAIEAVVRAEHPITLVRDLRTGEISAIGLRETARAKFEPTVVQQALGMLDAEFELRRLHSPIGLELGGRTPEEIAAEIVAVRRGGSTRSLSATNRPIHAVSDAQPSSA